MAQKSVPAHKHTHTQTDVQRETRARADAEAHTDMPPCTDTQTLRHRHEQTPHTYNRRTDTQTRTRAHTGRPAHTAMPSGVLFGPSVSLPAAHTFPLRGHLLLWGKAGPLRKSSWLDSLPLHSAPCTGSLPNTWILVAGAFSGTKGVGDSKGPGTGAFTSPRPPGEDNVGGGMQSTQLRAGCPAGSREGLSTPPLFPQVIISGSHWAQPLCAIQAKVIWHQAGTPGTARGVSWHMQSWEQIAQRAV